jgi:hypothetical protein
MAMIAFDPMQNQIMRDFIDDFIPDPVLRLQFEKFICAMTEIDPRINQHNLDNLGDWSRLFRDPSTDENQRKFIAWRANAAVVGILQTFCKPSRGDA